MASISASVSSSDPMRYSTSLFVVLLATLSAVPCLAPLHARGTYQTPERFLKQTFPDGAPKPAVVWMRGDVKKRVEAILGHRYPALRIRYWRRNGRSAWILDEIGKSEAITVGIFVAQGQIEKLRILIFRESRGDEVRHPGFTRQFERAALDAHGGLNTSIESITGATLSVRAVKKLAILALYLDSLTHDPA